MRKRTLFLIACIFVTGLVCYRYQRYELVVVPAAWMVYEWICYRRCKKRGLLAGRCLLILSAFFLGQYHMTSEMAYREKYLSQMRDGEEITVWGEVIKQEFNETTKQNSIYLSNCYYNLSSFWTQLDIAGHLRTLMDIPQVLLAKYTLKHFESLLIISFGLLV